MLEPNHFKRLLSNPDTTVEEDLEKLEQLLQEHPYLQSARALQLKIFKQKNSALYNDALRKTAAHTTDRDILFQFITSEAFTEQETQTEPEVDKEEVPNNNSDNIEAAPVTDELEIDTEQVATEIEDSKDKDLVEPSPTANEIIEPAQDKDLVEPSPTTNEITEPAQDKAEEILELDQPLAFNKQDSYSFSEWLQLTSRKPIVREMDQKAEDSEDEKETLQELDKAPKTDKVIHLVDAFLKNNPRPKRKSEIYEEENPDILDIDNDAPKSLMTETLARVYLQQKNYKKAIQAYKILILKNPEKSGYFADKIRAIENLTNKK